MVTIKQYAESRNISYEAARQSIRRYANDLTGHIITEGRTRLLDETAVSLLDEKRRGNPVVVLDADKKTAMESLQAENKALLVRVADLSDQLIKSQQRIIDLQDQLAAIEKKPDQEERPADTPDQTPTQSEERPRRWWQFWKR